MSIELRVNGRVVRGRELLKRTLRKKRVLGAIVATLVTIPLVAAAAPIAVPNTFTAGEVISSSQVNADFAAVVDGVNAHDDRIGTLETDVTDQGASIATLDASATDHETRLSALEAQAGPKTCQWAVDSTAASSTFRLATCPANMFAIAGGCYSGINNVYVEMSQPHTPTPTNGAPATTSTAWYCEFPTAATNHVAFAMCCGF
jgi:hypothetical protein